jgi:hypothetical protein
LVGAVILCPQGLIGTAGLFDIVKLRLVFNSACVLHFDFFGQTDGWYCI